MYLGPLTETDLLASQLFAIHEEALCEPHSWLDLKPERREAWIQVAQWIEARRAPPQLIAMTDNTTHSQVDNQWDVNDYRNEPDHK